jgi:hypothetical protein
MVGVLVALGGPLPACASAGPTQQGGQQGGPGPFTAALAPPRDESYRPFYTHALAVALARWADALNGIGLRTPAPVALVVQECETAAAPASKTRAVACYQRIAELLAPIGPTDDLQLAGTTLFLLGHELGRILIDVLDLPVTGGTAVAADQFAALILLSDSRDGGALLRGPALALWRSGQSERGVRLFCWIYGASAPDGTKLVEDRYLSAERAQRCPTEYREITTHWQSLLAPHGAHP